MTVTIIADRGSHLLVSQGERCAIIERRADRLYSCHDGKRDGIPLARIDDIGTILRDEDWIDKASARSAFDEIVERGTHLSETML